MIAARPTRTFGVGKGKGEPRQRSRALGRTHGPAAVRRRGPTASRLLSGPRWLVLPSNRIPLSSTLSRCRSSRSRRSQRFLQHASERSTRTLPPNGLRIHPASRPTSLGGAHFSCSPPSEGSTSDRQPTRRTAWLLVASRLAREVGSCSMSARSSSSSSGCQAVAGLWPSGPSSCVHLIPPSPSRVLDACRVTG
jgi:hypothetical protein